MVEPGLGVAILDTNTVLDWLVFADPSARPLASAIADRRLVWMATTAMRQECTRVVAGTRLATWSPDAAQVHAVWDRWATLAEAPPVMPRSPRCTDPDDQMFIDLALSCRARWLLSRDRALLRLDRRLSPLGVRVLTPGGWASVTGLAGIDGHEAGPKKKGGLPATL